MQAVASVSIAARPRASLRLLRIGDRTLFRCTTTAVADRAFSRELPVDATFAAATLIEVAVYTEEVNSSARMRFSAHSIVATRERALSRSYLLTPAGRNCSA